MSGGYDNDYDSDCDYYDYDDDYIYADAGAFDLAASEAPALYYRDDELEEYDNYNFWSEIEYGNNEIFDRESADTNPADKKKKSKAAEIKDTIKKIRLRGIQDYPTVLWKSSQEAFSLSQPCPIYDKPQQPTALLPNWRQLLKDRPAVFTTSYMAIHTTKDKQENAEWEDMSEDNDEEEEGDEDNVEDKDEEDEGDEEAMGLQDIDPEMLKSALAARLSASGMAGKDQSAMMEAMLQMLAGGDGAANDDLLESLTSNMLNQVTEEGGDSSMGQWLAGQGVSLEEDTEAGDEEQETNSSMTAGASKDSSPKDSVAAEQPAAPKLSEPSIEVLLEPQSIGKKRKHPLSEVINQDQTPDTSTLESEPEPIRKRLRQESSKPSTVSAQPKSSARKPSVPQTRGKMVDDKATAKPKPTTSSKPKPETTQATNPKPQTIQAKEKAPLIKEPTKPATRKRKATEEPIPEEKPKRQLRNFAAPTASSQSKTSETKASEPKTTRSGRARK
ncbi:hypothetical protein D6D01_07830 [Aureobasidium pullulans]|uniref:Uncharacterized protein n=1 Tax=Aureobasidium pullulans TaxID=5580 RepID=A0A4S9KKC3_AURPU|nr:hypothetical protein D6D01_07830 [Aureobasidium pullulans]